MLLLVTIYHQTQEPIPFSTEDFSKLARLPSSLKKQTPNPLKLTIGGENFTGKGKLDPKVPTFVPPNFTFLFERFLSQSPQKLAGLQVQ